MSQTSPDQLTKGCSYQFLLKSKQDRLPRMAIYRPSSSDIGTPRRDIVKSEDKGTRGRKTKNLGQIFVNNERNIFLSFISVVSSFDIAHRKFLQLVS